MAILSSLVLVFASLFSALLAYRQPAKLTADSKTIASIITLCAIFISLSALIPIFFQTSGEQQDIFRLMLQNLQQYLAIPLLCSVFLSISFNKTFTKATWGRWSLVLLATFELCRRAEVGEAYSTSLVIISSALILFSLFFNKPNKTAADYLTAGVAATSYSAAMLLFSSSSMLDLSNLIAFNLCLSIALIALGLHFGKRLITEKPLHNYCAR